MDPALLQQLQQLATFGQTNDARETARPKRMLNITPETGRLLWILVKTMRASRILEVARRTVILRCGSRTRPRLQEGRVITLESKAELARANLRKAGLLETVEIREGLAADTLKTLPGAFDLVFLDADRENYLLYLESVIPKLRPGGLLVADNATSHASELAAYLATVQTHPQLFAVTVPIGNGEQIAAKL